MFLFGNNFFGNTILVLFIAPSYFCTETNQDNCMCSDWEEWTGYGPCTAHCGGGTKSRSRSRQCNINGVELFDNICTKNATQYQICNTQDCGCEEVCSPWGKWNGECSVKCGGGALTASRQRQCQGSIGCQEHQQLTRDCNTQPCKGCTCNMWSNWSEYGSCSTPCGNGEQRRNRTRECSPRFQCADALVEYAKSYCNLGVCCEDACTPWSQWKEVSCSSSCDNGTTPRSRTRICALNSCNDEEKDISECKRYTCPETCNSTCTTWGSWTIFPCTKSCGGGTRVRKRTRTCIFYDCLQDDIHLASCNNFQCVPTDCNNTYVCSVWGEWKDGSCSQTCDVGTHTRTRARVCNVPGCAIEDSYEAACKEKTCEATCDSTCSGWSNWNGGMCSKTCGEGNLIRTRNRTCVHDDCQIEHKNTSSCNLLACPETCNSFCSLWSGWKSADCPVTCGGGILPWNRVRLCDNPDCPQSEITTSLCNTQNCDEKCDLQCSQWSGWIHDECSASCGTGVSLQSRSRVCSDKDCDVEEQTPGSCKITICPGTCDTTCSNWTMVSNSSCSDTCETNQRVLSYTRQCPYDGCNTTLNITDNCHNATCRDKCDNICTDWSVWVTGNCSESCGGVRNKTRSRQCPSDDCDTILIIQEQCNKTDCVEELIDCDMICNDWSRWTDGPCSVTCDSGTQMANRSRTCDTEKDVCSVFQTKEEHCHYITCHETCDTICTQWSGWTEEVCSVTCGLGVKHRFRTRRCPQRDCLESHILMEPCEKTTCDMFNIQNDHESNHITPASEPCKDSTDIYLPHPTDCNKFLQCVHGIGVEMSCPATTGWNPIIKACDHKRNIPGC